MTELKEDEKKKFADWINLHWRGSKSCPICQTQLWTLSDHIMELRPYAAGDMIIGGVPLYPIVSIICNNCGHMIFFNAIRAGLHLPARGTASDPDTKDEKNKPSDKGEES